MRPRERCAPEGRSEKPCPPPGVKGVHIQYPQRGVGAQGGQRDVFIVRVPEFKIMAESKVERISFPSIVISADGKFREQGDGLLAHGSNLVR